MALSVTEVKMDIVKEYVYDAEDIYELRKSVMNAITIIDEIEWRVPYDLWLLIKDLKKEMHNLCTL